MIRQLLSIIASTSMECSRVGIVLCGRNEVWPTRSLAKRGLNLPSPSPPPPRPRPSPPSPPAAFSHPRPRPELSGRHLAAFLRCRVRCRPRSLASPCPFPIPERLSLCLLSLSLLYFLSKNASTVPWRTRHSLVAQMRTSRPKKGRTQEVGEVWPSGEHGVSMW